MTKSPPATSWLTRSRPTTAGMALAWAMMAVWLVGPPMSVTKPMIQSRSIRVVSAGLRSWATTTTFSRISESWLWFWPERWRSSSSVT